MERSVGRNENKEKNIRSIQETRKMEETNESAVRIIKIM
jgi:hypothetical protein